MRISARANNTLQVFKLGTTTNKKIAPKSEKIVQTYSYSKDQFEYVKDILASGAKVSMADFFSLDTANCFDCPFSKNSGNGKCYTHKYMQFSGFISMLKSIVKEFNTFESIPTFDTQKVSQIASICENKYVRFGSYGEPTLHPLDLVRKMVAVSKNWTGYTHQYFKNLDYGQFFMASVHNQSQAELAQKKFSYRSFVATKDSNVKAIQCPASKEGGFKSNCSACGLCSGTNGKGKKDVVILEH